MIDQNELAFGQYYGQIHKGQKKPFLSMIASIMGMSTFYWQQRFSEWRRGKIRGKRLNSQTKLKLAIAITKYLQQQSTRR